MQMALNISKT